MKFVLGNNDSGFAFECLSKGVSFQRADGSSCLCTAILAATCSPGTLTRSRDNVLSELEQDIPRARSIVVQPSVPPTRPPPPQDNRKINIFNWVPVLLYFYPHQSINFYFFLFFYSSLSPSTGSTPPWRNTQDTSHTGRISHSDAIC